ncbi:Naphthalene 1,2-dioxygenase system ferredoxin subunit [Botrimarina hoheduenensis]|uniref:Naphthalene 1,2-dioxygenase system ferredoxin subunit n=2 Tax=Botrimarina hoheduenensis TaxID=2528000 RepID=A0A5C5VNJ1_9BACT|nr:Naphthalene 1,2-dioxygenase system ferredoxin subunit [Botrimarina hoheduenensis]
MEVVIGTTVIALAHAEGAIFAIDGICAHQGGPLGKARLEGCQLTCPWHGWQYDLATGKQLLSRTIAQRVFSTRVVGDTIQVRLPPIG